MHSDTKVGLKLEFIFLLTPSTVQLQRKVLEKQMFNAKAQCVKFGLIYDSILVKA